MSELYDVPERSGERRIAASVRPAGWIPAAVITALVLAFGALAWAFALQQRLATTEAKLAAAEKDRSSFGQRLRDTDASVRASAQRLNQQISAAQQRQEDLASHELALSARQQADAQRLQKSTAATNEKLGSVSAEVSSVKTDVGSVKTDVASARTDLADTRTLLQRTIGDAGVMSGLIARNHDELEVLKHRGDRTYYEFTLHKNAPPTLLATIKLQLKKTNEKKSRFNMVVSADDRNIEKKDKTIDEPVQFYTGKNPVLYELVVNSVGHDVVSGYLSVPKGM